VSDGTPPRTQPAAKADTTTAPGVTVLPPSQPPVLTPPAAAALLRLLRTVHRNHVGRDITPEPNDRNTHSDEERRAA
jgi:hypothetical protein